MTRSSLFFCYQKAVDKWKGITFSLYLGSPNNLMMSYKGRNMSLHFVL
jgi:hypothetical protein